MREIKFRGKASHSGEWLFGYLINICGNYHILGKDDMREDGHHVAQDSDRPTWVDIETVGQFTGLIDKNGKEIYEGDHIKWYEIGHSDHDVLEPPEDYIKECMGVVQFIGGTFCVEREEAPLVIPVEFLTEEWQANDDDMFKWVYNTDEYPNITVDDMYICEVLGNIHDNPELLEKGGER